MLQNEFPWNWVISQSEQCCRLFFSRSLLPKHLHNTIPFLWGNVFRHSTIFKMILLEQQLIDACSTLNIELLCVCVWFSYREYENIDGKKVERQTEKKRNTKRKKEREIKKFKTMNNVLHDAHNNNPVIKVMNRNAHLLLQN